MKEQYMSTKPGQSIKQKAFDIFFLYPAKKKARMYKCSFILKEISNCLSCDTHTNPDNLIDNSSNAVLTLSFFWHYMLQQKFKKSINLMMKYQVIGKSDLKGIHKHST